ncbi:hypothetical protein [Nocardia sp. NPDC051570]|uniref:hypothetical protein n=1 Tax=Nocardia sp. NPDC051570 TaxID=3364324 RepID=UPI0037A891C6
MTASVSAGIDTITDLAPVPAGTAAQTNGAEQVSPGSSDRARTMAGWFNHRRLYQHCGDMPPAEVEAAYYAQNPAQQTAGLSHQ